MATNSFCIKDSSMEFFKYSIVSAIGLFFDYGTYWLLAVNNALSLSIDAVIGYSVGLVVAYFFMVSHVFDDRWLSNKKHTEFFLFILSGVIGIVVTYFTVAAMEHRFEGHINIPKLVAVGTSFFSVYLFRKFVVFRKPRKNVL